MYSCGCTYHVLVIKYALLDFVINYMRGVVADVAQVLYEITLESNKLCYLSLEQTQNGLLYVVWMMENEIKINYQSNPLHCKNMLLNVQYAVL